MTSTIIQGDAIEIMSTLPDKSVDLVLCDPPFGVTRNAWDQIIPFEPMWREVWRVCTGAVVLMAMQPFSSMLVMSQVDKFRHEWVWAKNKATGHLNAKKAPMRAHEVALVFSEGSVPYYPQGLESYGHMTRRGTSGSNYGRAGNENFQEWTNYPRDVVEFDCEPSPVHPTQKPVKLCEYLVRTYSQRGDTVLDFSCGSGTTGVACVRNSRNFIGIELDPKYAAIAKDRIDNDAGPLFAAA